MHVSCRIHDLYHVQTRYIHIHIVFTSMFVYILVHTLYVPSTYIGCTSTLLSAHSKAKSSLGQDLNPLPCADCRAAITTVLAASLLLMP